MPRFSCSRKFCLNFAPYMYPIISSEVGQNTRSQVKLHHKNQVPYFSVSPDLDKIFRYVLRLCMTSDSE